MWRSLRVGSQRVPGTCWADGARQPEHAAWPRLVLSRCERPPTPGQIRWQVQCEACTRPIGEPWNLPPTLRQTIRRFWARLLPRRLATNPNLSQHWALFWRMSALALRLTDRQHLLPLAPLRELQVLLCPPLPRARSRSPPPLIVARSCLVCGQTLAAKVCTRSGRHCLGLLARPRPHYWRQAALWTNLPAQRRLPWQALQRRLRTFELATAKLCRTSEADLKVRWKGS
mmetsp:Transcript_59957/g.130050  ORF Transcript_59957/g.130050 Transcript_59957/m.130050 type:complete len:229 (-) Transcript_59957:653-1339(-)